MAMWIRQITWPSGWTWDEFKRRTVERKGQHLHALNEGGHEDLIRMVQRVQLRVEEVGQKLSDLEGTVRNGMSVRFPDAEDGQIRAAVVWVMAGWVLNETETDPQTGVMYAKFVLGHRAYVPDLIRRQDDWQWMTFFSTQAQDLRRDEQLLQHELAVMLFAEDEYLLPAYEEASAQRRCHYH